MTFLQKIFYGLLALCLTACNTHNNETATSTSSNGDSTSTTKGITTPGPAIGDSDITDLKRVAAAMNAKTNEGVQASIDAIQNRELKFLAIAATIKTPAGETEALGKITNSDVKNLAIAFSSKVNADRKQAISAIQNPDLKNIALGKTTQGTEQTEALGKIRSGVLLDFAKAITGNNIQAEAQK